MKYSVLTVLALATASLAAPLEGHKHHQHQHKRDSVVKQVTQVVYVDSNGNPVTSSGTAASTQASQGTGSATTLSTITSSSASSSEAATSSASETDSGSSSTGGSSSGSSSGISGDLKAFSDPTDKFEDGKYKCSEVPTGQGVIAVDWISGLNGGWTSVMNEDGDTSSNCKDGYYCSYACQAGMSKTQWPSEQPSNGISVGGLYCKGGYLYKSNSDQDYLCSWGEQTAEFSSEISKDIAICRTDYPGSENMNIPTLLEGGNTAPASVVDSADYYTWKGGKTSTQYYVNNAGVTVEDGCIWGTEGSGVGNWAPVVLGAGVTDGKTYLSLIPNPNNQDSPNYNVKIVGESGANVNGDCKYENGSYNGKGTDGCTVTVSSGKAKFVFYN